MLIKGECLRHTTTMAFSIHGEPRQWELSVSAPGNTILNCTTNAVTPYAELDELLAIAFDECCRRFPERMPPLPKPKPSPLRLLKRRASRR